jgi:hypothetical protein
VAKKKNKKIVTKDAGYGIGVPVLSTTAPTPSSGGSQVSSATVQTPNTGSGIMSWPAANQWYQNGSEATKKAIVEYANVANQLQSENDSERRLEFIGKLNLTAQSVIQGTAIAAEAAELQSQKVRTGDQAAQFELSVTEDSLKRLLKILWIHNLVAKKGIYPGVELKLLEAQLTGRINRTTTLRATDIGIPLELDKGENPSSLWTTTPPSMEQPTVDPAQAMAQPTVTDPTASENPKQEFAPNPQPATEPEQAIEQPLPEEEVEPEEEIPYEELMGEGVTEEAPMDDGRDEMLRQREAEVAQREASVAQREASIAQREASLNTPEEPEIEEEEIEEVPEGEEEIEEEEIPEEDGEEIIEEEPEIEEPEEEVEIPEEEETEEEPEEEPETKYCIYCDQEVTPEEIEACTEEKCPFKTMEQPEEEEVYKHFVILDHNDHDDHNVTSLTFKEYTDVTGTFCVDCQKLVSCEFDSETWDQDQVKTWVKKQMKRKDLITKSPEILVQEALDEISDEEIVSWIEQKKVEDIYGKGLGFLADLTEEDIKPMVTKGIEESINKSFKPLTDQLLG